MKNKWGCRKKHNLTECGTAIVLGIAKLTLMGRALAKPRPVLCLSGFVPLPDLRKNGPKIIRIGITYLYVNDYIYLQLLFYPTLRSYESGKYTFLTSSPNVLIILECSSFRFRIVRCS